jgi:hypothetical protein
VRTSGEPTPLLGAVRDQVQTIDRNMPLRGTGTIQENIDAGLWAPRMGAALLSIFGGLALVLGYRPRVLAEIAPVVVNRAQVIDGQRVARSLADWARTIGRRHGCRSGRC